MSLSKYCNKDVDIILSTSFSNKYKYITNMPFEKNSYYFDYIEIVYTYMYHII